MVILTTNNPVFSVARTCPTRAIIGFVGGVAWLEEKARLWLKGRAVLSVPRDVKAFVCCVQHEVCLGLQISEEEAVEFGAFQVQRRGSNSRSSLTRMPASRPL